MKIINVVGARPNFMKIAPIMRAMKAYRKIKPLLVHTGQHYDANCAYILLKIIFFGGAYEFELCRCCC